MKMVIMPLSQWVALEFEHKSYYDDLYCEEQVDILAEWCAENNAYWYQAISESFSLQEAIEYATAHGYSIVIVDN